MPRFRNIIGKGAFLYLSDCIVHYTENFILFLPWNAYAFQSFPGTAVWAYHGLTVSSWKCRMAAVGLAASGADSETLICPDCGTREALESIGVSHEEQEEILRVMHNAEGRNTH